MQWATISWFNYRIVNVDVDGKLLKVFIVNTRGRKLAKGMKAKLFSERVNRRKMKEVFGGALRMRAGQTYIIHVIDI